MRATWMTGCAALLAMTFSVGCGSSTDSGATANGTTVPATAPAVDASQRLVGQWHGEVWLDEAEVAESGALTEEQVAALKATTMDVHFESGGKMLLSGVNGDQFGASRATSSGLNVSQREFQLSRKLASKMMSASRI